MARRLAPAPGLGKLNTASRKSQRCRPALCCSRPGRVQKQCQPQALPDPKAGDCPSPRVLAGAIALAMRYIRHRPAGFPKAPDQRLPRPGGRFSPAGSGAGLPLVRVARVLVAAVRAGRGNAVRFGVPPEAAAELRRCHGRGHRPCHSARLTSRQPGAQSPRPAPAPPPAGASRPPGRALACVMPGPAGLRGTVTHGRGKRMRFLVPPGEAVFLSLPGCPVTLAGAIAPATAPR
jgi:hypothetical protein